MRKRVSRACNLCRARKVRCIIENPAGPCVNCRHNDKVCTFKRRHGIISTTPSLRPNDPPTPRSVESATTTSEPRNILPAPTTITQNSQQQPPNFSAGSPTHPDYAFLQVPDTKDLLPQDLAFLFVSSDTIKMLGFEDVHQAKLAFYRRSKLLYDFSVEKSCIAIAQASLLLAHTHLIPRCIAGNKPLGSIWLGIAISYARVSKAHCYSSLRPNKDTEVAKVQKLRNTLKRLWWCCIICDRLLPLTSRQSIKITPSNFSFSCSKLGNVACGVAFEAGGSLCGADGCFDGYDSWSETKTTLDERMAEEISPSSSIILFKNLIEMYYHSARLSVCHYNILRSSLLPPSQSDTQLRRQSEDLQGSASRVTECLLEFDRLGLSRWLPMTAIGCTAFPLALQMIDVELLRPKKASSPEEGVKLTQKEQHVENILKQMKSYKKKYYITDWVMRAIRHVVELARQRSPAPMSTDDDSSPSSCLDMLKTRPSYYLRLVMTLDMSISNGRLPDECDFPPSLRKTGRGLSSRSQATSMPTVDEQSMKRFSAMNKHLIPDNLTDFMDHNNLLSNNTQTQDLRTIDQEAFFNNKQPFPADLTAALCEITNIPPLDFSDMSLMDSTHFNDFGGVPFWPYDLLGSPPDQAGGQVEEVGMGDMFNGLMGEMNDKTYEGNGKEGAANNMVMDSF
ncbi:cutinase transcription factor 1 beta [Fusarium tjaetaba]|uniref:Cutinase transcription factor 1 beta n=1 Tax=Fusarium tjaetaba TaxID=1567544 RepID=A0A8H5VLH5_9HYPO|nr:cutinase transcription factor 1 beta [Fusarium tjaetaba]KAF5625309.1 cutinase transcription factor 1 beta [Fusarium tjaetaba]